SGLDSMILGETQILGQVRDAFLRAQANKATGTIFNELFKQAITFAKKAHKETSIGEHAVSVSYAAIQLAKKEAHTFEGKNITRLGSGKMGSRALKHVLDNGGQDVTVLNRTCQKAQQPADEAGVKALGIERPNDGLGETEILVSPTGASRFVLTSEQL